MITILRAKLQKSFKAKAKKKKAERKIVFVQPF